MCCFLWNLWAVIISGHAQVTGILWAPHLGLLLARNLSAGEDDNTRLLTTASIPH